MISCRSVSLIMRMGAERPFRHDRHFSEASNFHIGVSRGRRFDSHGRSLQRHQPELAIHESRFFLVKPAPLPSGKCLQSLEPRAWQGVDSRFRPMPPKPPGRKKTCLQVGGPSLKTWGRFGSLDRGRRLCTSAALVLQQGT